MASPRCQHRTLLEQLRRESLFSPVVREALVKVVTAIEEKEAVAALNQPEYSEANFDHLISSIYGKACQ
jgi:hypothetical protein